MKKVTGVAVFKRDIGTVINYVFTELDENGTITRPQEQRSKVAISDQELEIDALFTHCQQLAENEV